jgi:hypothetical protein
VLNDVYQVYIQVVCLYQRESLVRLTKKDFGVENAKVSSPYSRGL